MPPTGGTLQKPCSSTCAKKKGAYMLSTCHAVLTLSPASLSCAPRLARLFSVQQPPALVFVIDTTGSMFEEITAARLRALAIIQGRANSGGQPGGTYLLVPFHDPGEDLIHRPSPHLPSTTLMGLYILFLRRFSNCSRAMSGNFALFWPMMQRWARCMRPMTRSSSWALWRT